MLDLMQLETFLRVVATQNISKAAEELGTSQSSVTTRIKALERELGGSLFERRRFSRGVVLTDIGAVARVYAERILALAKEAQDVVKNSRLPENGSSGGGRPASNQKHKYNPSTEAQL